MEQYNGGGALARSPGVGWGHAGKATFGHSSPLPLAQRLPVKDDGTYKADKLLCLIEKTAGRPLIEYQMLIRYQG